MTAFTHTGCSYDGVYWSYLVIVTLIWSAIYSKVEAYNPSTSWRNYNAFAALKEDGTVQAWGDSDYGGSGVPAGLTNIKTLFGSTLYYSDSTASSYFPCPPRFYGPGFPHCQACPSASSSSADDQGATPNLFSPGIRSTISSCVVCSSDRVFSLDGVSCSEQCAEDYAYYPPTFYGSSLSSCRRCHYRGMAYNHTSGKCQRCPVGRYSNGEEETDGCRLCGRGTYAASEGQERCVACSSAVGKFTTSNNGSISRSDCFRVCDPGYFAKVGDTNKPCYKCPPGKFTNKTGSVVECEDCSPGKYADKPQSTNCSLCTRGKFSDQNGADRCLLCDVGTFSNTTGMSKCSMCDHGNFRVS